MNVVIFQSWTISVFVKRTIKAILIVDASSFIIWFQALFLHFTFLSHSPLLPPIPC